jgi:uracil-DNA glycosylase
MSNPPAIASLKTLHEAEASCTRCELFRNATQVVPGEGPTEAKLMMVGEQPGDQEDLAGRPFVGPAGRVLDRALAGAGIDRKTVFVTNAVKHFKFEPRGKRRLHKKPNAYEIERCRWWNELERAIVKPALVVALGATAARSLLGRTVSISKVRGEVLTLNDMRLLVTVHPSYLLRIEDEDK